MTPVNTPGEQTSAALPAAACSQPSEAGSPTHADPPPAAYKSPNAPQSAALLLGWHVKVAPAVCSQAARTSTSGRALAPRLTWRGDARMVIPGRAQRRPTGMSQSPASVSQVNGHDLGKGGGML